MEVDRSIAIRRWKLGCPRTGVSIIIRRWRLGCAGTGRIATIGCAGTGWIVTMGARYLWSITGIAVRARAAACSETGMRLSSC